MSETTQNNQPNPPPRPPRGFPRRELPQIPQKPTRSNTSGQLQNLLEKEKQDLERGVLERSNSTNSISQRPNPTIQVPEENQVLYSLKKPPSPFSSSNSTSFSSSSSTSTFSQNSTSNVNSTSSISSTNNSNLPPVSGQTRTNRSYSTKPVPSIPIRTRALSGGASELKNAVEKINTTPKEETEFGIRQRATTEIGKPPPLPKKTPPTPTKPLSSPDTPSSRSKLTSEKSPIEPKENEIVARSGNEPGIAKFNLRHVDAPHQKQIEKGKNGECDSLFQYILVFGLHQEGQDKVHVKTEYRYPPAVNDGDYLGKKEASLLASIPQFCFPDLEKWKKPVVDYTSETFSFILTELDGSKKFGYCRRVLPQGSGPRFPEVCCIISPNSCFSLFSRILDIFEERRKISSSSVYIFLKAVVSVPFPEPGETVTVKTLNATPNVDGFVEYSLSRPDDLLNIEHVNFDVLFKLVGVTNVIKLFVSLLLERRIIFTSSQLSRLSDCTHSILALLYPFQWQHVLIPILPTKLIDFVCSPTPFVVGVLSTNIPLMNNLPIEEALIVNIDEKKFIRQDNNDIELIDPTTYLQLRQSLKTVYGKKALKGITNRSEVVLESFLTFTAGIMVNYRKFFKVSLKGTKFSKDDFLANEKSKGNKKFLEAFSQSQMFQMFIQEREALVNSDDEIMRVKLESRISLVEKFETAVDLVEIQPKDKPLKLTVGGKMLKMGRKFKDFNH